MEAWAASSEIWKKAARVAYEELKAWKLAEEREEWKK